MIEFQREWGAALAGYSTGDISRGLDKCIPQYPSWPPTVGEFMKLCEIDPESLGLPTVEQAWLECSNTSADFGAQIYSHGIVLAVRKDPQCDIYRWRLLGHDQGIKKFKQVYQNYLARAMQGECFDLPKCIEDKRGRAVTKDEFNEIAARRLPELKRAISNGRG